MPLYGRNCFEWANIKQDLKALQEITIEDRGKTLAIRSECLGTCGKIFQAVGVAIPSTIREVARRNSYCRVERWRGGLGGAYLLPTLSAAGAKNFPKAPIYLKWQDYY